MRYFLKFRIPIERGNELLASPDFGAKMQQLLTDIKAETCYFSDIDGQRGGYAVVNLNDASEIPLIAEPFFLWLEADIEMMPVMLLEDLAKAGPSIAAAAKKWG